MNGRLLFVGCLRAHSRFRFRSLIMGLGVSLGVAGLLVSRALGAGAEATLKARVEKLFGSDSILIGGARGIPSNLQLDDLRVLAREIEEIEVWDPILALGAREIRGGGTTRTLAVYGRSERAERAWNRGVILGRFLSEEDLARSARVALIGTRVAEDLFGDEDPLGQEILVDSIPFRVCGILEPIGVDPHGTDRDEDVVLPITTAMRRVANADDISGAKLLVREASRAEALADEIREILRERHAIGLGEQDDFALYTPEFVRRQVAKANRVLRVFVPLAVLVLLLVASVVVSSIMLIAMRQRSAEVGLRRAVGATRSLIGLQFLGETVILAALAGMVGLGFGSAAVGWASGALGIPAQLTLGTLVVGMGSAVAVGVLSGVTPALVAARLDPVASLR